MPIRNKVKESLTKDSSAVGLSLLSFILLSLVFSFIFGSISFLVSIKSCPLTFIAVDIIIYVIVFGTTIGIMTVAFPLSLSKTIPRFTLLAIPIFLALFVIANYIGYFSKVFFDFIGIYGRSLFRPKPTDWLGATLLLVQYTVLPAILEELLFRKVLLFRLRRFGNTVSLFISAFIFAILHFDIPSFPVVFFIGLILGYLTLKYMSIIPAVIIHFLYNLTVVILSDLDHMLTEDFINSLTRNILSFGSISFWLLALFVTIILLQGQFRRVFGIKGPKALDPPETLSSFIKTRSVMFFLAISVTMMLIYEFLPRIFRR
ncbi:MAG: CPBP family intramembrane metalloprotease [Oscillospiraceae bacterium]|nr:CPBP family intramembrane metalloprotease [Oscillospiraceae bacterium]